MAENNSSWYLDYLQKVHQERLDKIKKGCEKAIDNSLPESLSFSKLHNIGPNFAKEEESKQIYKKNKILLNKLTEISKRKVIAMQNYFSSPSIKAPIRKMPKTLNFNTRNENLRRISEENNILYHKLKALESNFSQRQMENEYKMHERLKIQLSKRRSLEPKFKSKEQKDLFLTNFLSNKNQILRVGSESELQIKKDESYHF